MHHEVQAQQHAQCSTRLEGGRTFLQVASDSCPARLPSSTVVLARIEGSSSTCSIHAAQEQHPTAIHHSLLTASHCTACYDTGHAACPRHTEHLTRWRTPRPPAAPARECRAPGSKEQQVNQGTNHAGHVRRALCLARPHCPTPPRWGACRCCALASHPPPASPPPPPLHNPLTVPAHPHQDSPAAWPGASAATG